MDRIGEVLNGIQAKWGQQSIQSARHLRLPVKTYASGFMALDREISGIPRAHLTELIGRPSSGLISFAWQSVTAAQKEGANVVVIDRFAHLDMASANLAGVNVENLLLVEVAELPLLLELLKEILHSGVVNYILVNLLGLKTSLNLRPVLNALHHSDCALVLLLTTTNTETASLRLQLERQKWLRQGHDIVGCLTAIKVEKQRFGFEQRQRSEPLLFVLPFAREADL